MSTPWIQSSKIAKPLRGGGGLADSPEKHQASVEETPVMGLGKIFFHVLLINW